MKTDSLLSQLQPGYSGTSLGELSKNLPVSSNHNTNSEPFHPFI